MGPLEELQTILLVNTTKYFVEDNPIPGTSVAKVVSLLFSSSGATGQERAKKYMSIIQKIEDVDKLASKVYEDCCSGELKNSTKYRRRLLQGLCEFYQISNESVDAQVKKMRDDMVAKCSAMLLSSHAHAASPELIANRITDIEARIALLVRHVPRIVENDFTLSVSDTM